MAKKLPASMRTREEFSALIEGRPSSPAGRPALVELATHLIVEKALEGEARDTLDRDTLLADIHAGYVSYEMA